MNLEFRTIIISASGAGTFTKPAGITKMVVECWGGGGSGAGPCEGILQNNPMGGGAGGQYARRTVLYSPEQTFISYSVAPQANTGTTCNGSQLVGFDTIWDSGSVTTEVVAKGGGGASGKTGAAGSSVGGVGDVVYAGGSGLNGNAAGVDGWGSGGGGAGSTGTGSNAVFSVAGQGASEFGGNGGNSPTFSLTNTSGNPGLVYGGGGGGAWLFSQLSPIPSGGAGAQGLLRITYFAGNPIEITQSTGSIIQSSQDSGSLMNIFQDP